MYKIIFILILSALVSSNMLASSASSNAANANQNASSQNKAPISEEEKARRSLFPPVQKPNTNNLPNLGDCSEFSDYYIYQCQPFKCSLPLANSPGVYREMSTLGFQNDKCIHKISFHIRHENFRQADIHITCKLSEEGRKEMSSLFTRYKNGDITAYTGRSMGRKLGKECR